MAEVNDTEDRGKPITSCGQEVESDREEGHRTQWTLQWHDSELLFTVRPYLLIVH
jgi:hypothetical protein